MKSGLKEGALTDLLLLLLSEKKFQKLKFLSLDQIFKLKYAKKAIKVKKLSTAARLAAAAHASPGSGGRGGAERRDSFLGGGGG